MWDRMLAEFGGRGFAVVIGLCLGSVTTWCITRWKRHHERQCILDGDARDTVVIVQHLVERAPASDGSGGDRPLTLRLRSLGQSELNRVVPNGYLANVLLHRAFSVNPHHALISMDGAEGSYLLETLTNFVCDRVSGASFDHELYVMAPCCEPAEFSQHQPITILLISVADLKLFRDWTVCRNVQVEHGTDGARVLTLMEMAKRFDSEQAELVRLRKSGQRTRYAETMYTLDLALDARTANIPCKPVPWGRFEGVLKAMNLE